jgi:hypothetical protein
MAAAGQIVELVSTKEIELFLPLMREIDFGDAFLLSMLHWCGIGKRSKPLEYWQVFLLRAKSQIVGVSGLYRQPGMPPMSAGSAGLQFVLNSAAKASAAQRSARFAVWSAAPAQQSFGFTPVPKTRSLGFSISASALKSSALRPIAHPEKPHMILTSSSKGFWPNSCNFICCGWPFFRSTPEDELAVEDLLAVQHDDVPPTRRG